MAARKTTQADPTPSGDNGDLLPAGTYQLHAQWDELVSEPGKPAEYERHNSGDLVKLNQEEANRLRRVISKPGERQKQAAVPLRAEAERLAAEAERLEAEAKAVESGDTDAADVTV